jgi:hypothetical protein
METSLEKLVSLIADLSRKAIALKSIIPREEILFNWELEDFKYTEKGAQNSKAHGKETIKKDWFFASRKLSDEIVKSAEFKEAEGIIKKEYPQSTDPQYDLHRFCDSILPIYLEQPQKQNRKAVINVIRRFIRDLKREPIIVSASFNVYGIALESNKIKLADGIVIRRTVKEDFEVLTMAHSLGSQIPYTPYHSAVLKIDLNLSRDKLNNSEFQILADKYIALFRLFRVGGVHYTSYRMFSDIILPPFFTGMMTMNANKNLSANPYFVKKSEEKVLHNFLNNLQPPKDIYHFLEKKVNHLTIAFDRYSEALLENTYPERKITNVVMGMEALFSSDSIELNFRLSTRVSKVLSFLGQDSLKTKETLLMAYKVRSTFSHGGHLDTGMKNKLEREYSSVDNFLYLIANYLRIGLIVMLSCGLTKENLIKLIDNSLIDSEKNKELKLCITKVKTFLEK